MLETRQIHNANARIEKAVTGLCHKSLTSLRLLKLIKSEWLERIFNRTYQDVDNVADALKMKQQKYRITVGIFLNFPNFRSLSVLGIQITRVWGYSLPPSGLIEIKRKSCDCIIFFCAPMPIYRVLFWSKFPAGSGHIIKCLLMWVWFGSRSWSKDLAALGPLVMTPSQILVPVRPYHSSNEYTVFRFCTSHCYH